jgi:TorA maturation chaperone TorD
VQGLKDEADAAGAAMSEERVAESAGRHGADADSELRASTYRLLATLFAGPPSQDLLDMLKEVDVGDEDAPLAPAWRMLALAARQTSVAAVDDEYHALFVGITRGEVMPYGSWYLTGFLMERPLAELRQDLQELGYARREEVKEPEDHVAALCETMSMLILDKDIGTGRHKRFFDDHIEPWMVRFFQDLQAAETAEFYGAVGLLGEEFLQIDKQYLGMLPN